MLMFTVKPPFIRKTIKCLHQTGPTRREHSILEYVTLTLDVYFGFSPRPNELIPEVSAQPCSLTEYSKSALTDHANQANHTIDWKKTTVIDREQDRPTRWIKEAVHILKEGHRVMNRDEGSYQLSHAYTTAFLMRQLTVASRLGRTEYQLLLMKIS